MTTQTTLPSAPMLTIDEVGEHLKISPREVRRLCTNGDLEFVKIGSRTLRFKPEWVDDMIRRKQGKGRK